MFTVTDVAKMLKEKDKVVILCHRSPDGDTIGSAYALYDALKSIGKTVRIECADTFGTRFAHITDGIIFEDFIPEYIVAVDVPNVKLLGKKEEEYPEVDLCIDHHGTHVPFAKYTYVESTAASACEIMYEICSALCGEINEKQAIALYTGVATDTGCFKFSNTTIRTHLVAVKLMEKGIDCEKINQAVFSKTKNCAMLGANVVSKAKFYHNDKIAIQFVDEEIKEQNGASEEEVGILASLLQEIDCVMLGITIRQIDDNTFRISVRTKSPVSAAEYCKKFGGGGHNGAAGATLEGNLTDVYDRLLTEALCFIESNE